MAKSKKQKRVRRSPEEARAHILAAAQRVFASQGPDASGLKAVAAEAGVSHGLVTHYFGTYDALVEAAIEENAERAQAMILERLAREEADKPDAMIDIFFETIARPEHGRLLAWALLSGRMDAEDFFVRRRQGPKRVADAIEARLVAAGLTAKRDEIEHAIVMFMTVAFGYALGRDTLWEALGREPSAERDRLFRRWLAAIVTSRILPLQE